MTGERMHWRNLIAACAAVSVFSFSLGEMYPLLALKMESWGTSKDWIGYNSAMSPIGVMLAGLVISRLAHRFGAKRVALTMTAATGCVLMLYPVFPTLAAWFALRFLQGGFVATLFALSEAWVVRFAHGRYRARVTSIYAAVIAASFGLGAAVLGVTGIEGHLPFLIGAAVMFAAMPLIALVEDDGAELEEEGHMSFFAFAPKAPLLLVAILAHSIFDGAMIGFMPVYAVAHGFSLGLAALTVTALAFGNFFFQLPIGWIADHVAKRKVILACFIICLIGMGILPWLMQSLWLWLLLPVVGAANFAIYSVGLATLGDEFSGAELVAGTTAFSSVWGLGALLGSLISGYAMAWFGAEAYPIAMMLVCAAYFLAHFALKFAQMRRAKAS